jgi:hypothetical protein
MFLVHLTMGSQILVMFDQMIEHIVLSLDLISLIYKMGISRSDIEVELRVGIGQVDSDLVYYLLDLQTELVDFSVFFSLLFDELVEERDGIVGARDVVLDHIVGYYEVVEEELRDDLEEAGQVGQLEAVFDPEVLLDDVFDVCPVVYVLIDVVLGRIDRVHEDLTTLGVHETVFKVRVVGTLEFSQVAGSQLGHLDFNDVCQH